MESIIKISGIIADSVVDGVGIRYTIFTQGCVHNCVGCHNPETHNYDNGTIVYVNDLLDDISKYIDVIDGITLSGGDPLYISNYSGVLELCEKFKKLAPNKSIWMYTGYKFEDIDSKAILDYVDVIVDGKFEMSKIDSSLRFKGSSNQRIIDVRNTIKKGSIVIEQFD